MDRGELAEAIRKGFWGNQDEIQAASDALALLLAAFDQAEAAVERYAMKYGAVPNDPQTELRLKLQRGE